MSLVRLLRGNGGENGFVKIFGGAFNPLQPSTRAVAAAMIESLLIHKQQRLCRIWASACGRRPIR